MSKYYDKELQVTVHVTYGGRYSGKTYREFRRLKEIIKQLEEEHKELVETNYNLATEKTKLEEKNKYLEDFSDSLLKNNGKAANYIIDHCISEKTGRINDPDILEIYKALSGGGEPVIKEEE